MILGGIYSGVFTPEEAGAVGAFSALVIALIMKRVNLGVLRATLSEASRVNATVFILFSGATLYGRFIALSGLPNALGEWIEMSQVSPMILMAIFMLMYF